MKKLSNKKVLSKKIKELGIKKYTSSINEFKGGTSSFINVDNKKNKIVLMIKYFEKGNNFSLSTYNTKTKASRYVSEFDKNGNANKGFQEGIEKILKGKPVKAKVELDY